MRAGVTVGGLTTGRMLIAQGAIDSLKIGCVIAIRYALQRPQFGGKPIMEYVTHQLRLLPALGDAYALHLAMAALKNEAFSGAAAGDELAKAKQVHVMSAGMKAASTWLKVDGLQKCRECCGGQGFLAINKIGPMAVDTNVDATFEGDNTVMMAQVAKALVDTAGKGGAAAPPPPPRVADVAALADAGTGADTVIALLQYKCAPSTPCALSSGCVCCSAQGARTHEVHREIVWRWCAGRTPWWPSWWGPCTRRRVRRAVARRRPPPRRRRSTTTRTSPCAPAGRTRSC